MLRLLPILRSLVVLTTLALVSAQTSNSEEYQRLESFPHALTKPFLDKYLSSRFYDYGGNTLIRSDSFIRLTGVRPGESGWLFSKLPAMPENFQVEFDFKIHGGGGMYGDGMAMWVTTHKGEGGPVFGSSDQFEGLGVFFDTYKNNRPGKTFPYVMAMIGDGKTRYDAGNDGLANEVGACSGRGLHNAKDIARARVTYVKGKFLSLDLDYKGQKKWANCFVIDGVSLPTSAYLGFSARTGELSENHDLHRVQVYSLRNPPSRYNELIDLDNGKTLRDRTSYSKAQAKSSGKHTGGGSWLGFIFKILLLLAVILLAVVGYGIYITKNQRRKERDYYL